MGAFSMFGKGIGRAAQFAESHLFPILKTDYKALTTGVTAARTAAQGQSLGSMWNIVRGGYEGGNLGMGLSLAAGIPKGIARAGFGGMMGAYGPTASRLGIGARWAGYGAGAYGIGKVGMWGMGGNRQSSFGEPPKNNPYAMY